MSIENDAVEFGSHVRNGGWRLGLLVARSVDKRVGQGQRTDLGVHGVGSKISARAFAEMAKSISINTVKKYLDAWNAAADDGLVPASSELAPGQEVEFGEGHTAKAWDFYFKPPKDDEKMNALTKLLGLIAFIERTDFDEVFNGGLITADVSLDHVYDALDGLGKFANRGKLRTLAVAKASGLKIAG